MQKGQLYDVGTTSGNLLLAEGWALPADLSEPAMVIPLSTLHAQTVLIVDNDPDAHPGSQPRIDAVEHNRRAPLCGPRNVVMRVR